jgi:hypothetical protein
MRRGELVKVAAQLFRQRGFHGTSTRDIAAAAGMQPGSLFYFSRARRPSCMRSCAMEWRRLPPARPLRWMG